MRELCDELSRFDIQLVGPFCVDMLLLPAGLSPCYDGVDIPIFGYELLSAPFLY